MRVLLLATGLALAPADAALAKKHKKKAATEVESKKVTLQLRSFDRPRRLALVEISGLSGPPKPNFFTFTDTRGRKFVAVSIRCDAPFPSGGQMCEAEIPVGYERRPLVGLALHIGSLNGRVVTVPKDAVARAWNASQVGDAPDEPEPADSPDTNQEQKRAKPSSIDTEGE